MMKVLVRCDASAVIGSGHVMRCLTLADFLSSRGARIFFVCRELPGDLTHLIEGKGYPVHRITLRTPGWEEDAEKSAVFATEAGIGFDWLIVDHYRLDARYERRMRRLGVKILAIDDLADRPHDCDLLLDQNQHRSSASRYDRLVPSRCRKLLGPRYALLRGEFARARQTLSEREGSLRRLLVFFGGSDPAGATLPALETIAKLGRPDLAVDVVVGSSNPQRKAIREFCSGIPAFTYRCQVSNMAELMAHADLALGAGGSATWERCYLGLPSVTVVIAENQREISEAVADAGATVNLGWYGEQTQEKLRDTLTELLEHPQALREMQSNAFQLMDGAGDLAEEELLGALWEKARD